jgi:DAK2 domain fusion protein YloV
MADRSLLIDDERRERLNARYSIVDGKVLRMMTEAGLSWLKTNQQIVNSLNVFPVPDGDTGTNMVLTMQSAWNEIALMADRSISKVAHAIAHGALMGARGNSGVILSQLWRGFARTLDGVEWMDASLLTKALVEAKLTAYRGVVRPVEGTILTVSSDVADAAENALANGSSSALEVFEIIVTAADESVQRTPDLLPILKEAGVVDSGGIGLFFILDGMLRSAYKLPLDQATATVQPLSELSLDRATEAIEPGQDWEVVIDFHPQKQLDIQRFYSDLENMGTSIQVGEGDGLYRLRIHVPDNSEYEPIEYAKSLGTITNIAIENLMVQVQDQHDGRDLGQMKVTNVKPGEIAVVTIAPAPGIARVFASLGAAALVEGGQTMNPSIQEILDACENLPTDKIVILPNNKNVVMCANEAAALTVKNVAVVPTVSVPQGIAAMLALNPEGNFEDTVQEMSASLSGIQTAELTIATRSVEIDGVKVRKDQIIGLLEGKLVVAGDNLSDSLIEVLNQCNMDQAELITLYYGSDLTAIQANQLADRVRETWPKLDLELVEGGQPHYQLILSVE